MTEKDPDETVIEIRIRRGKTVKTVSRAIHDTELAQGIVAGAAWACTFADAHKILLEYAAALRAKRAIVPFEPEPAP